MYTFNCALLGFYAASGGNLLPNFLQNLSIGYPETSVRNYYYLLRNNPQERGSQLLRDRSLRSHILFVRVVTITNVFGLANVLFSY